MGSAEPAPSLRMCGMQPAAAAVQVKVAESMGNG